MKNQLIIVGAGGLGRVISDFLATQRRSVGFFFDENPQLINTQVCNIPVVGYEQIQCMNPTSHSLVLAILDPQDRNAIVSKLQMTGIPFESYQAPTAFISHSASIGAGYCMLEHSYIMNNACLDAFVHIHFHSVIGHDATVGPFSSFGPNCIIGGFAKIGKCVKMGMGVRVLPNITIGDFATIGAGSVVTRSIPEGEVWAGIPAKKLRGHIRIHSYAQSPSEQYSEMESISN